jgi:hypothetical protein
LTDGGRFVMNLESHGDDGATLTTVKNNFGPHGSPIHLVRQKEHHGVLRSLTVSELAARAKVYEEAAEKKISKGSRTSNDTTGSAHPENLGL